MENRSHALVAGIFALLLGAAMVWALWWFSDEQEQTREYLLLSSGSIGNLNVQATVRFRGMTAGKVVDIRLDPENPRHILVTIAIREDLPITRGTRAILDSQGVTGIALIQLEDRGEDPRPLVAEEGQRLPRLELEPSVISRISDAVLEAMYGLDTMAQQLKGFLNEDNRGRFQELLAKLEAIARGVDRSLAEVPEAVAALRELLNSDNLANFSALLANFEQVGAEAVPAVGELRELLRELGAMSGRLEEAVVEIKGGVLTTGENLRDDTLPRFNELLRDLAGTSRQLNRLLEEVESSPQILLRGRVAEPGPGESGW